MLHQAYLLEIDAPRAPGVRQSTQRTWWPVLVVPRAWCVFEAVPCRGLAFTERAQFARMQAKRLAPFEHYGFNACVRGNTLMLWFWDQTEVSAAAQSLKLNPQRTRLWVEPLLRAAPSGSGERRVACQGGVDVQTLAQGAVVTSTWQPRSTSDAPAAALRRWPWAWELARPTLASASNQAATNQGTTFSWPRLWRAASMLSLVVCGSFAAYWGAQLLGARQQLQKLQSEADSSTRRLGDLAGLRKQSSRESDWVKSYTQLSMGMQWPELLQALSPTLERFGVVMKEMETRDDEVKLVLGSAGSDIDLPGLLLALKKTPGLATVQLRAGLDFSQATFSMRAPGFWRPEAVALAAKAGP